MLFSQLHKSAINNALKNGLSFVAYRDKAADELVVIFDDNSQKPVLSNKCFFAVNWLGKYAQRVKIKHRLTAEQAAAYKSTSSYTLPEPYDVPTNQSDYICNTERLINELKTSDGKTVISRVLIKQMNCDITAVAEQYFNANKLAYCCLLQTPQTGCWLIASPELLLSADFNTQTFETVALAGTRESINSTVNAALWDKKNIAEQQIVSDFIAQSLSNLQLNFKASDKETVKSGNIEHLATIFNGKFNHTEDIIKIVDTLNPTPALCGMPRDLSIERINAIEKHPRRLYGGYFGFIDNEQFKAVVTLRCAQLSQNIACLYAGGGITAESIAQSEWSETTLKSQVLVNIITNLNNE